MAEHDAPNLPATPTPRAPKRRDEKEHLTIKIGNHFEASAGGSLAVIVLAVVAVMFIVVPLIERLWS